jgi:cytochrome d ubiquinol oxidase subunit I
LWILIANAWMQNPVGAEFNPDTMRMELTSFADLIFNPIAGPKFVHTVAAGYVAASMFVLGISSYYLLRGRDPSFAIRSFAVAAGFGLASALSVIVLGDESGYTTGEAQKVKLAAIEAEWETAKPPASFTVFGVPDQEGERTRYALKIPWVMGLIATRSVDTPVVGIRDLKAEHEKRIRNGIEAYAALQRLRSTPDSREARAEFVKLKSDLGYGLLLKKYTANVVDATPEQIRAAVDDTIPERRLDVLVVPDHGRPGRLAPVPVRGRVLHPRPAPRRRQSLDHAFGAVEHSAVGSRCRWADRRRIRAPAVVDQRVLPTHLGVSSVTAGQVWFSMGGFLVLHRASSWRCT